MKPVGILGILGASLLVPSFAYCQTERQGVVPFMLDTTPTLQATQVEVGFGRKLANTLGLVFFPTAVKRTWPLYAYDSGRIGSEAVCEDNSPFAELDVGNDIGFVVPWNRIYEDTTSNMIGWRIYPNVSESGRTASRSMLMFSDICTVLEDGIPQQVLQAWVQWVLDLQDPVLERYRPPGNPSLEGEEAFWHLLLNGMYRRSRGDSSSSNFIWTTPYSLNRDLIQMNEDRSTEWQGSIARDNIWKIKSQENSPHVVDAPELFVTHLPRIDVGITELNWRDVDFSEGNSFHIWYMPQQSGMTWYLVSDEPIPDVLSDLRIAREGFVDD